MSAGALLSETGKSLARMQKSHGEIQGKLGKIKGRSKKRHLRERLALKRNSEIKGKKRRKKV